MPVPCKVYYPQEGRRDGKPYKELVARTQDELDALLRIGWTTEKPKQ